MLGQGSFPYQQNRGQLNRTEQRQVQQLCRALLRKERLQTRNDPFDFDQPIRSALFGLRLLKETFPEVCQIQRLRDRLTLKEPHELELGRVFGVLKVDQKFVENFILRHQLTSPRLSTL